MSAPKYQILQGSTAIQRHSAQQKVQPGPASPIDADFVLYTKQEVADLLKVKLSTISAWLTQGRLSRVKLGACTRISRSEITKMVNAGSSAKPRPTVTSLERERMNRVTARARDGIARFHLFPELYESGEA